MEYTFEELLSKLAQLYDEVSLLELLNVNSNDIVDAFRDKIEERYEFFAACVSAMELTEEDNANDE